jgi:hypothetical protein
MSPFCAALTESGDWVVQKVTRDLFLKALQAGKSSPTSGEGLFAASSHGRRQKGKSAMRD